MLEIHTTKRIYKAIEDSYSKKVFKDRLIYSLLGNDKRYLLDIMEKFKNSILEDDSLVLFKDFLHNVGREVVVFGSGMYAKHLLELIPDAPIMYFVDNDLKKIGQIINGHKVISFSDFLSDHSDPPILIISKPYYFEMYDQLKSAGIPDENIIDPEFPTIF